MPVMSRVQQTMCRSLPWQAFTRRMVFPWAIGAAELHGEVLELGSGAGAMAEALLDRYADIHLTATDIDPVMRNAASMRLSRFGDRAEVTEADATRLPFADRSFDAVVSFIMLHHVVDWEQALAEVARVLRPGGRLAGYDLVSSRPVRLVHRASDHTHRFATSSALRDRLHRPDPAPE